jgi:ubiquinone/menaquinone biosynthesis C-methylase UbiE
MGYLIAGDWDSYQYLVESIRMFPTQVNRPNPILKLAMFYSFLIRNANFKEEFAALISDCGFKVVNVKNLTNGAVAIHSGFKF